MVPTNVKLTVVAAGAALVVAEAVWLLVRERRFPWKDSGVSFGVMIGSFAAGAAVSIFTATLAALVWPYHLFDIKMDTWWSWVAVMLYLEFTLYWFHRLSHQVRWMWASHAVHHSAKDITFMTAVRLPLTGLVQGSWVNMVLGVWIGFPLSAVLAGTGIELVYVFLLHTTLVPRLGPLEWVLNTPAHHRVHHSSEREHLDRNYGNMLIIFDYIFGSYVGAKREPQEYGLLGVEVSENFAKATWEAAFGEWGRLFRDMREAGSIGGAIRVALSSPSSKLAPLPAEDLEPASARA